MLKVLRLLGATLACVALFAIVDTISASEGNRENSIARLASNEQHEGESRSRNVGFYNRVYVLCIGINDYPEHPLRWAEKDAQAVANFLSLKYGFETEAILGPEAKKERIWNRLLSLRDELGPNDALIVFFAGHGVTVPQRQAGRAGFLVPYGMGYSIDTIASPEEWERHAISMREMGNLIAEFRARHVLFFVDACYSGFLTRRAYSTGQAHLDELLALPSRMVITAGTEDEEAYESDDIGHGIFTKALLNALGNTDVVSATELFLAIRKDVAWLSGNRMLPQIREIVIENGEFVFIPTNLNNSATAIAEANIRLRARNALLTTSKELYEALMSTGHRYSVNSLEKERIWEERFKRFEENALVGDVLAMSALSLCFSKGLGVQEDKSLAYRWAREAFLSEHPAGVFALYRCYRDGIGVEKNSLVADDLLRIALLENYPPAAVEYSIDILRGAASEQELEQVLKLLNLVSDTEYHLAITLLGQVYSSRLLFGKPDPYPQDHNRAEEHLIRSSSNGCNMGKLTLGQLYAYGNEYFGESKLEVARRLLHESGESGYRDAQYELARAYAGHESAYRFEQDISKAIKWGELAMRQEHPHAYSLLAELYLESGNFNAARVQIEKGIEAGDDDAITLKAFALIRGDLYAQDKRSAVPLLSEAAVMGNPSAQYMLSLLYADGTAGDVKHNAYDAAKRLYWLTKAAAQGLEQAMQTLREQYLILRGNIASLERGEPYDDRFFTIDPYDAYKSFEHVYPAEAETYRELMGGPSPEESRFPLQNSLKRRLPQ